MNNIMKQLLPFTGNILNAIDHTSSEHLI